MPIRPRLMFAAALLVTLALVVTACGGGGAEKNPGEPAGASSGAASGAPGTDPGPALGDAGKGQTTYEASCAACHGMDAYGLPGIGKDLANPSDWMKQQSDAQLAQMIKQGRPVSDPENSTGVDMPPKGGNPALSDDDINDIIAYLRQLQKENGH